MRALLYTDAGTGGGPLKFSKAVGTLVLTCLITLGVFLALVSSLFSFLVLNPAFLKKFVPSGPYCAEMREQVGKNLDHIAMLYGLDEGTLSDIVSDEEIQSFTRSSIDKLFNGEAEAQDLSYPGKTFSDYLRAHTAYSEQAAADFSEDCAESVTRDLLSLNTDIVSSAAVSVSSSRLAKLSPVLSAASILLVFVVSLMLRTIHSERRSISSLCTAGGFFCGSSAVFVPLTVFWLFDYIGRMNIAISPIRTALTGLLGTMLYGCLAVSGTIVLISFLVLLLSSIFAAKGRNSSGKASKSGRKPQKKP